LSKRSFPAISGLSCRSLTTGTLTMTTTKLKQSTTQKRVYILREPEELNATDPPKQANGLSDKVVCPYCNGYISSVDTFCIHCGEQFLDQAVHYCTRCGRGVDEDAKVCPYCGVRLHR